MAIGPLTFLFEKIRQNLSNPHQFVDDITQLWNDYTGKTVNQQTIDANVAAADLAWERQVQMFNMQNEYNSPAAQMQRARDAGLNPSLIYGQPISEASSPSGVPQASVGGLHSPTGAYASLVNFMSDAMLKRSQARLLDEQAKSESTMRQSRIDNLNAATLQMGAEIEDIVSKIKQRAKQNEFTDAQIGDISFRQMMDKEHLQINWKQLENDTNMTNASVEKLKAETDEALARAGVTWQQLYEAVYTLDVRVAGLEANVRLTEAKIKESYGIFKKLGVDAERVEQLIALSGNDEAWERDLNSSLAGEHGEKAQTLATVLYLGRRALKSFGSVLNVSVK